MMSMLPQWMKMAKDPDSVGAKFLNTFGVELGDIEHYLEKMWNNMYIGTADLKNADFCYKIPLALRDVIDVADLDMHVRLVVNGKKIDCFPADTLRVFYEQDENVYMFDEIEGYTYIKPRDYYMQQNIFKPFDAIEVGGTMHYEYMLHHTWNPFDEFGMLLGIRRLPGERNEAFKNRILDVFKNPGGATKIGITNALSRELGIDKSEVKLGSLSDDNYVSTELMNPDGTPTKKYIGYVDQINSSLGFAWDHMNWGEAYWRSIEENNLGFHYLPHIWDGFFSGWKDSEIQSGVGSEDDLLVDLPRDTSSVRNFKSYVGLRATEEQVEESYPELHFKYKIVAKGKIPNDEYNQEPFRYTVIGSEIINLHYVLTAMKTFLYRTSVNWDGRYVPEYKDQAAPGMKIVTGENILHNDDEEYVKFHIEMKTTDRTVTPELQELIVNWVDSTDTPQTFTLTTDADFTQSNPTVSTTLQDVVVKNNAVSLSRGSFSAIIDTEGSFLRGEPGLSIKVNKTGSISLNLPNL